ncbi:hypothetical protein MLD38_034023 [Melastoma candidum]|uniref:Uncharacterized protein n=1 Tax=Melastoma candidum TaxID=119954 RepID=A0ACB9MAX6_9MYRT|nr:hypothetical protein MLD38_034023 [Melastoma candidum]
MGEGGRGGLRTDSELCRRIVTSFLHFLSSVEAAPGVDLEGLDVARECLSHVFRLPVLDPSSSSAPDSLVQLFQSIDAGPPDVPEANTGNAFPVTGDDPPATSASQGSVQSGKVNSADASKDDLFGHFFAALENANFFIGTPDGNDEALQLDKATQLFHNALAEMESSGCQDYSTKSLAETLKAQGNKALQAKLYVDAIEFYSIAIALDGNNAVYYCNRAAAYIHNSQFSVAINDCFKAIEIDPNYWKAYSRLGNAYYGMGRFADAIEKGYKKALLLDPNNESIKENIWAAESKLKEELHRRDHNQHNAGTQHDSNAFSGQSTSRPGSGGDAAPPLGSFPFDPSSFPANFANVFMNAPPVEQNNNSANPTARFPFDPRVLPVNLANMFTTMAPNASSHGEEQGQSAPGRESNNFGFDGPGIRIGDNINLSMGGNMPEEISGALRNVMQMFAGSASHGSPEPTSGGTTQ